MSKEPIDSAARQAEAPAKHEIPVMAPAGISTQGFVTEDGTGVIHMILMQGASPEQAEPVAIVAITSAMAFDVARILNEAAARTELQAVSYRKQHARRLENERKQAHGGLILPTMKGKPDA